jgi:hypothetical protein
MLRRIVFCIAASLALAATAQSGTLVNTASGSIGGIELDNAGVSGGVSTIVINRLPNLFSFVNTVNGGTIIPPDPVVVQGPVTMHVVADGDSVHYNLSLAPPTYTEAIGPGATEAVMTFGMSSGIAPISLPNFFNMSGSIMALLMNTNPTYDYSRFAKGGTINLTLTGTTFSSGISSFAQFFATPGASIVANGSFSQSAVPEPPALVLALVGLPAVFWFLKRFAR